MRFSTAVLTIISGFVASPLAVNAFSTTVAAFVGNHNSLSKIGGCGCASCLNGQTHLYMSDAEVPAEVEAMDGVASEEEAHNTERPARDSGIKKHKRKNAGTPIGDLEVGSFVDGTVKTVTSYGAFVDIGATTDALLHVSRLSSEFVSNVEDVVKAGDSVSVRVVSVDAEKGQVAISLLTEEAEKAAADARNNARGSGGRRKERPQRSQGDRSAQIATLNALNDAGFDTAQFVEGEVVSTLAFGAFVRFGVSGLAEGVEGELDGLVHISSLAEGRTSSVEDVVSVGDKVQVRVRNIDTEGNKVSLSMITVEQEEANKPKRGGGQRRRGRAMFTEEEMGAADWKESLEAFQKENPTFTNMPIIVDKRKEPVSA